MRVWLADNTWYFRKNHLLCGWNWLQDCKTWRCRIEAPRKEGMVLLLTKLIERNKQAVDWILHFSMPLSQPFPQSPYYTHSGSWLSQVDWILHFGQLGSHCPNLLPKDFQPHREQCASIMLVDEKAYLACLCTHIWTSSVTSFIDSKALDTYWHTWDKFKLPCPAWPLLHLIQR